METNYLTNTKVSKSKNGKSKSYTYSTVIPKVIVNKFGLEKGKKLYWDINDKDTILITPELPEEESIQAGNDILTDMLINGNTAPYSQALSTIKTELEIPDETKTTDAKVQSLVNYYNGTNPEGKDGFTQVVTYLLDYPLNLPDQYEILREVYKQITQSN